LLTDPFLAPLRCQARADELVKTSIDGGINFFDTADNYTEGESEKILGQSLKNLNIARKDVVIATKVYSRVGSGRNGSDRESTRV
jgi:aryl-alcohol dehydrogenase-like predicted oxidoreductase